MTPSSPARGAKCARPGRHSDATRTTIISSAQEAPELASPPKLRGDHQAPIRSRTVWSNSDRHALVIGSSAKCSVDGHSLAVCLSPRAWATRHWQEFGSRSEADCYSFIITLPPSGECTRRERWHGLASPAHTLESRTGRPGLGGGDYRERSIGVEVPASPHQALVGRYGLNFQAA